MKRIVHACELPCNMSFSSRVFRLFWQILYHKKIDPRATEIRVQFNTIGSLIFIIGKISLCLYAPPTNVYSTSWCLVAKDISRVKALCLGWKYADVIFFTKIGYLSKAPDNIYT